MKQLPTKFLEKLQSIYSPEELKSIEAGFSLEKRPTTFRVNTLKASNEEIERTLSENNIAFEKIAYLNNGYKLINAKEKELWNLSIFTEGKIYLQGITSQMIGEVIKNDVIPLLPASPLLRGTKGDFKVLDLTAAPGGKTSHIWAILENNGSIIANELGTIRREKLKFTIERQWCSNVEIVGYDARNLKDHYSEQSFDMIIADVPCSAEWRVNLNQEKSYGFLSTPWLNKRNYKLQKEILEHTVWLLKENGILIYSTCTLDPRENEGIAHFLLSNCKDLEMLEIPNDFPHKKSWLKAWKEYIYHSQITKTLRIIPSVETEGFYIALFRKKWTSL